MARFEGDGDEEFPGQWWLYEANMQRCFNSRTGQEKLREIREALVALPRQRLIHGRLADEAGDVCAVGAIALHQRVRNGEDRGSVLGSLASLVTEDTRDSDCWAVEENTLAVGAQCGIKTPMVVEIASRNDGTWGSHDGETPEQCYWRVLAWVESMILVPTC